jgi:hypothetical protein
MEQTEPLKNIENIMFFDPKDTHKWHPYRDSDDYVSYLDEEEGVIKVTKKFNDEDWDEMDNFFDSHPLFNNDLGAEDLETNEYLQALQAIKYDQNAEEIMEKLYVSLYLF